MKEITLKNTNEYVAIVDDEDYKKVSQYKWSFSLKRVIRTKKLNNKILYLHQFILLNYYLNNEKTIIIHIDGNFLNCTRENLKIVTVKEKARTKSKTLNNKTSVYKGVCFQKDRLKWRSSICVDYKKINLGSFCNEKDAAKAYNEAATKYFGEFAKLNKIEIV